MMLILQKVLEEEDVARIARSLADGSWHDGKATAGGAARTVKNNLQTRGADAPIQALETFVEEALRRHPLFAIAARPRKLSRLMFSRYEPGMEYGAHTDDAIMSDALRTDLAFTLFLADPETYEGGALTIESALGEQEIKLSAGDAILYPAGTIHRVSPVTQGARLACVGWVQSLVADAGQREVLFDLAVTRTRLTQTSAAVSDLLVLDKAISNLLRMWARP
jgi:PKHD-type hydroxylase